MRFGIYFLLLIWVTKATAQTEPALRPATYIEIFNESEKTYISEWAKDAIQEMNFTEEELIAYAEIWEKYSAQLDTIGKVPEGWKKSELIDQFNSLMDQHFEEMRSVLKPDHFRRYKKEFKILKWNANIRLEQL